MSSLEVLNHLRFSRDQVWSPYLPKRSHRHRGRRDLFQTAQSLRAHGSDERSSTGQYGNSHESDAV